MSAANVRTTYAYDSAGRVSDETVTREAGGTTNLYKTAYAYSYLTYGRQLIRTEQDYSGGWNNDNKVTYTWDSREYQDTEERHDDVASSWVTRYDVTQEYDKNGNRTRMHRNTASGYETDYGNNEDLSYTFNNVNQMSAIADTDDANYSCTVVCDANNNITQLEESQVSGDNTAVLVTDFTYDWGNRLTEHKTRQDAGSPLEIITLRGHTVDAIGRTVKSAYSQYPALAQPPTPDTLEHTYDRSRHEQNYDGTSTYGEAWHWAGAQNQHSAPLKSPNPDTAGQKAYNISNDKTPQRRTFTVPTSEGDQRHLYGQGKPQAKNSSGSGADWYIGTQCTEGSGIGPPAILNSRTMFDGTVTATDMDRATDAREKGRIGIFGTGNAYAGSSGRVTSERIGRDLNPNGRGDGSAYVGGAMNYGQIAPKLPKSSAQRGWGNSVNNGCCGDDSRKSDESGSQVMNRREEGILPPMYDDRYDPGWPISASNCDCFSIYCSEEVTSIIKTYKCDRPDPANPGRTIYSTCRCKTRVVQSFKGTHSDHHWTIDELKEHCGDSTYHSQNCCTRGGYFEPKEIPEFEYITTCGGKDCKHWCIDDVKENFKVQQMSEAKFVNCDCANQYWTNTLYTVVPSPGPSPGPGEPLYYHPEQAERIVDTRLLVVVA